MSVEPIKLELLKVFAHDAGELTAARLRCETIHHTKDIKSAGNEVETTARSLIARKLPTSYCTSHGHIVDSTLTTSPQIDVAIVDNRLSPILFQAHDGTEYFPYESVYAIGEIKSTYSKSKGYIPNFVSVIHKIKNELKRDDAPSNYLGNGIFLGEGLGMTGGVIRNPLFSFMLFVNSGDLNPTDLVDLYASTPTSDLPNLVCFLDRGTILNAAIVGGQPWSMGPINVNPAVQLTLPGTSGRWIFVPFGDGENRGAANFGVLWMTLMQHLRGSALLFPEPVKYLGSLVSYEAGSIILTKP